MMLMYIIFGIKFIKKDDDIILTPSHCEEKLMKKLKSETTISMFHLFLTP